MNLKDNSLEPGLIVHIRPPTFFRDPELMGRAIEHFKAAKTATALRSVHEMSESAYKTFEIAATGEPKCVGSGSTVLDAEEDFHYLEYQLS